MTLISRLVFFKKKKTFKKSSNRIKTNEISIVIPVKDNQEGINNFLEEFIKIQSEKKLPKEIIIVDNNSNEKIKIGEKFQETKIPIKLIRCRKIGPASARNLGVKKSTGNWILFVDSDCIPTDSLLSGYLTANKGAIAYAGNIKSVGNGILSNYYISQEILIPLKTEDIEREFVPQYLITANCLVLKSAFEKIKGFNENIKIAGGEDVDLGLRLSQIGRLEFAFNSIAKHNFNDGIVGFIDRFKRYGKGNRIIEDIYGTKMKPTIFRPNKKSILNEVFAKLQWLFLLIGYLKMDKMIKNGYQSSRWLRHR
jgi:glycosyltransferase involved in cell wall biosynthesis